MKNACYNCPSRTVWIDANGKAHSCHESCDQHARDQKRFDVERANRREQAEASDAFALYYWRRIRKKQKDMRM